MAYASGDKYAHRLSNARRTNSSRIPHLRIEFLRRLRCHGLARPAPLVQQLRQAIVDRAVHLGLCLEVRQAEHRPAPGHDACLLIGQRLQPLEAADDAANPAAGRPVDDGPALARDGVTHREHVLLGKVHVQIAVGVRGVRDVAVANAGVELAGRVEGLVRLRDLRQALEALPVPGPGDVGRQPQPRVLVRDDRRAGLAQPLVRAGLLGVPVRVEDRVNRTAAGQAGDGFHQRIGSARQIRHRRAGRRSRRCARRHWLRRGFSRRTDRRSVAACRRLRAPPAPVPQSGAEPARPERSRRRRRSRPSISVYVCERPGPPRFPVKCRRPDISGSTPKTRQRPHRALRLQAELLGNAPSIEAGTGSLSVCHSGSRLGEALAMNGFALCSARH